jgi:hypothetical protein
MFHETMRLARAEGVEAVVKAAQENPLFVMNNAAGPFSALLHASEEARAEVIDMGRERYIQLIVEFRDGIWPANLRTLRPPTTSSARTRCRPSSSRPRPLPPHGVSHRICETAPPPAASRHLPRPSRTSTPRSRRSALS